MSLFLLVGTAGVVTFCRQVEPSKEGQSAGENPIHWDVRDGWPTAPGLAGIGRGVAANVILADRGAFLSSSDRFPDRCERLPSGRIEVVVERAGGRLTEIVEPWPAAAPRGVRRRLRFTNTGKKRLDVVRMSLSVGVEAGKLLWAPRWFRMYGEASGARMLCVAAWSEGDFHHFESRDGLVRTVFQSAWRLDPGESAVAGWQVVWAGDPRVADACRAEARTFYRLHGFTEPVTYPSWLFEGALYEASAAGHIDSRFSDTGGFDSFARYVPYLADLGVVALWLNAVQSHKTPPDPVHGGWNHYDPRDYGMIDPILGGTEAFVRLGATLKDWHIHLLSEIVPHGGHSIQGQALEQWWTRERDGKPRHNWGGCGMDNASPEWQNVLRDSMALVARHADVEGLRIDVADGQGPNWGSPATHHASRSGMTASREMLRAVADGIRAGNGTVRPLLIPEAHARPEYFQIPGAVTLGYGLETTTSFFQQLPTTVFCDPIRLNRRLRAHFEKIRGSLPPGALDIQSLNNHDTVCAVGRAMYRFGVGLHRALYAVCVAVPGIPMMYQEEEIGSFFAFRRLNHVRRDHPWLAAAAAMYPAEEWIDRRIFAVWRHDADHLMLCLINVSGDTIDASWDWRPPVDADVPRWVHDVASNRRVRVTDGGKVGMRIKPYEAIFLVPGRGHRPASLGRDGLAAAVAGESGLTTHWTPAGLRVSRGDLALVLELPETTWTRRPLPAGGMELSSPVGRVSLCPEEGGLRFEGAFTPEAPPPVVRVAGAHEWAVSGRTGLLHDRVLFRHASFPGRANYHWQPSYCWGTLPWGTLYRGVAPVSRLWQTLLEPLHPDRPALGFADAAGRGILLHHLQTDAMNVVLSDGFQEADSRPGELRVSFYAVDPDLHPDVQRGGLRPFWRERKPIPVPPRPLNLSFTVSPSADIATALSAPRRPFDPGGPLEERVGKGFSETNKRIFVIEPGRVEWHRLPAIKGRFRLEFELRLSERSGEAMDLADAYIITLDGKRLDLTWTKKNVWSTGNAYFAKALSNPVDLGGKPHTLIIRTTHSWCAMLSSAVLVPAAAGG